MTGAQAGEEMTEKLTDQERGEIVARLTEFFGYGEEAKRLRGEAASVMDRDSMERATDLMRLYEDRTWIEDLPPIKPGKVYAGKPVTADSFGRFQKWVQSRGIGSAVRANQLINAHRMASQIVYSVDNLPRPRSEGAIRPLWREFFKWGGESERIGVEVYRKAVELAAGEPPTQKHVREALAAWKAERRSSMPVKTRAAAATYIDAHDKALREIRYLLQVGEVAMAIDTVKEAVQLLEAAGLLNDDGEIAA